MSKAGTLPPFRPGYCPIQKVQTEQNFIDRDLDIKITLFP